MNKENEMLIAENDCEKLMYRLTTALNIIRENENELTEWDVSQIEGAAWDLEGRISRNKIGTYWRDWYPMS